MACMHIWTARSMSVASKLANVAFGIGSLAVSVRAFGAHHSELCSKSPLFVVICIHILSNQWFEHPPAVLVDRY